MSPYVSLFMLIADKVNVFYDVQLLGYQLQSGISTTEEPECGHTRFTVVRDVSTCWCHGLPFPHQQGTRHCEHHPDGLGFGYGTEPGYS